MVIKNIGELKTFHHSSEKFSIKEDILEQVNTDNGRFYKTPEGKLYPSVTTVTGLMSLDSIKKWRQRVGEDAANAVTSKAARRGTRIHKLLENYINNEPINDLNLDYNDYVLFSELKPHLDTNLDNVLCQEARLYSDYLEMAGTVDCVAEWKGKLSIIDFKTSTKAKNREYITNYFCQASAYAIMFEERFKIPVSRIVILIATDTDGTQIFEDRRDNFTKQLLEVRKQYKERYTV